METRMAQLRYKEVISVEDGSRFGFVGDLELDLDSGRVRTLIVPGRLRLFGLLGREPDWHIPWEMVRRFGEDIILVEGPAARRCRVEKAAASARRRSSVGDAGNSV